MSASVEALVRPDDADTIAALASPPGAGARAVVRVSGKRSHELARRLFAVPGEWPADAFAAIPGKVRLPGWPEVNASAWLFRAPRSYTGEDAVELHLPGAPAIVGALLRELARNGAREARPGEFTRRAFLGGRLDLAQAEAVLALTRAEEESEVRAAARALLGGLRAAIDGAKGRTLDALAHVEAAIDFPEEDLPGLDPAEKIAARVEAVARELAALEGRSRRRAPAGLEPVVVIAGLANAGKSTLLNALAGHEAAIVSPQAGTTRDPVAATVVLEGGRRVKLVNTAGEKTAQGEIERAALERTRELASTADALVYLVDLSLEQPGEARKRLARVNAPRATLVVGTKLDLAPDSSREGVDLALSARTGEGLDRFRDALVKALDGDLARSTDQVQTERQARLVARAREALDRASALLRSNDPARMELASVDLREVLDSLGELTGALVTDDLLDKIFGEFCIGK